MDLNGISLFEFLTYSGDDLQRVGAANENARLLMLGHHNLMFPTGTKVEVSASG